ncbi:hypothetical protein GCM10010297_42530 [Streptomyces malachitofuscus]|nr:hypothetical protein GCM10010297_42530 [Streptomyces malachitofuscus]
MPRQHRRQCGGDVVVVFDEKQSHRGPLPFIGRTIYLYENGVHARVHLAVTPMDEDDVKRVPVALSYRYPAGMSPAHKCYDRCPIAIGS